MKQHVCPQCGEPVPDEEAAICMVCGQSLKQKRFTIRRDLVVTGVLAVLIIVVSYFYLFSVMSAPITISSTGNVFFTVTLSDGTTTVEYQGTADGSAVEDFRVVLLTKDGGSIPVLSMNNPQPGTVSEPIPLSVTSEPVAVYYVVRYTNSTETRSSILI